MGSQISGLQVVTLAEQGQEQVVEGRQNVSQFKKYKLKIRIITFGSAGEHTWVRHVWTEGLAIKQSD